jgi:hypothetical protein
MFDIAFLENEPTYTDEDGWSGLWGRIVLGEFSERFISPVGWWGPGEYERQWIEGANRLLGGATESAFVEQAGRVWWTAWREGESVVVQQRLLITDASMSRAWSARADDLPYELVGKRETHSDGGRPLSQWLLTLADLQAFVGRRIRETGAG